MLATVMEILARTHGASAWRIVEHASDGEELYLIGNRVDMRRFKKVRHLVLTVYSDFEDREGRYRGSVTVRVHPAQGTRQIRKLVEEAVAAARFVRNAYYPLVEPGTAAFALHGCGGTSPSMAPGAAASSSRASLPRSRFEERPLPEWLPELSGVLAAENAGSGGSRLNSAELFLQRVQRRILNSQGVDVGFHGYDGYLELIVESQGGAEDVELYKSLTFAEGDLPWLRGQVRRQLQLCADRAAARPTPRLEGPAVLITGEAVRELFAYYLSQTAAESVYSGVSRLKVADSVQGGQVRGDLLSMSLEPYLPNSVSSAPWDDDGFALSPVTVVEDGILRRLWGPQRFCYYLGVPPTGSIPNLSVRPGPNPLSALRERVEVEVVAFSDFRVEPVTGDFGAEIRLAYLRPSREGRPITGGSVSGNLSELHGEMYLTRELQRSGDFVGPEGIYFPRLSLAGVDGGSRNKLT
jgi:predicted Zn-dependent protease